jgi:hypothetical protein
MNYEIDEQDYLNQINKMAVRITKLEKVVQAAVNLREAQKAYMANRGSQEHGKNVAVAAKAVDEALAELDAK